MSRQFYGIGLNFGKSRNGYFSTSADKKLIKESIMSILLTKPGERVHLPDFGVGLSLYLFEPNDGMLEELIKNRIIEQVTKYEPGVDVVDIAFNRNENELNIQLKVRMKDFNGSIDTINYSLQG